MRWLWRGGSQKKIGTHRTWGRGYPKSIHVCTRGDERCWALHTLHKKWSFPLRISSVIVTKSAGNWGNPQWKTSFFVQWHTSWKTGHGNINPFRSNVSFQYCLKSKVNLKISWWFQILLKGNLEKKLVKQ